MVYIYLILLLLTSKEILVLLNPEFIVVIGIIFLFFAARKTVTESLQAALENWRNDIKGNLISKYSSALQNIKTSID